MPAVAAAAVAVARFGFGELERQAQAQRSGATDWLTERLSDMQLKTSSRERPNSGEGGRHLNEFHVWFEIGATSQYQDRIDALSVLAPPCVRGSTMRAHWPQVDKLDVIVAAGAHKADTIITL